MSVYFEFLPSELITIIISELSFNDLNNFAELHNDLIDWNSSFLYRFKEYVYPNYKQFNVKNLYVGLLEYVKFLEIQNKSKRPKKYPPNANNIDINRYLIKENVYPNYKQFNVKNLYLGFLEVNDGIPNFHNVDINRYMVINNIIYADEEYVGRLGDIFIYEYLKDKLSGIEIFKYSAENDNLDFSEHVLKELKNLNDEDYEIFVKEIKNIYSSYLISLEMTKLILKYYPETNEDILEATYESNNNFDSFKYIINNYNITNHTILEILHHDNLSNNALEKFILIVDKFYDRIKKELPQIYFKIIGGNIETSCKMKIKTYLSNKIFTDNKKLRI